jgi:hypothetical protein
MPSASKPRARLYEAQVIAIFQAKASTSAAAKLAMVYGVSEKAIRDIWKGRAWSRETWHLDTSRPLQLKLTGRPKRCRDTKPRKRRVDCREELSASTVSTSQVPCRHTHTNRHGFSGHASEQDTLQLLQNQHASRVVGFAKSTESAACFEDSSAWYQSRAAWRTSESSTPCHASVDEQLLEWDTFWRASTTRSADPFCGDWNPY